MTTIFEIFYPFWPAMLLSILFVIAGMYLLYYLKQKRW